MLHSPGDQVRAYFRSNCRAVLLTLCLSLFAVGCEESKSPECAQILQVSQDLKKSNQDFIRPLQESDELKSWLEAANNFEQAADRLIVLEIDHSELITYQNQLATIYRLYAQATYDAVRARENQNLSALKLARQDAVKAGKIQQQLIRQINTYCLKK